MKRQLWSLLALTAVVSFLLGLIAAGPGTAPLPQIAGPRQPEPFPVPPAPPPAAEAGTPGAAVDFATVVARLNGTVVNVDTISRDSQEGSRFVFPRRWSD